MLPEKHTVVKKTEPKRDVNLKTIVNVLKIAKRMTKSYRNNSSIEENALLALVNKHKEKQSLSLENPDKILKENDNYEDNNEEKDIILERMPSVVRRSTVVGGFITSKSIADLIAARKNQTDIDDELKDSDEDELSDKDEQPSNDISKGVKEIITDDLDIGDEINGELDQENQPVSQARPVTRQSLRTPPASPTNRATINRPKVEVNTRKKSVPQPLVQINQPVSQSTLIQNIPESQEPQFSSEAVSRPISPKATIEASRERSDTSDDILADILDNMHIDPINVPSFTKTPEISKSKPVSRPTYSSGKAMNNNQQNNRKVNHLTSLSLDDVLSSLLGVQAAPTSTMVKSRTQSRNKILTETITNSHRHKLNTVSLYEDDDVSLPVTDPRPKSLNVALNQIIEEPKNISVFATLKSSTFSLSEIVPVQTDAEYEKERANTPYKNGYQPERFNNKLAFSGLDGYKEVAVERTRSPSPSQTSPITSKSHPNTPGEVPGLDSHKEEDEISNSTMSISKNSLENLGKLFNDDDFPVASMNSVVQVSSIPINSNPMLSNIQPVSNSSLSSPSTSIYDVNSISCINMQTPALVEQPVPMDKINNLTQNQEVQYVKDMVDIVDPGTGLLNHDSYANILNENVSKFFIYLKF
jgi:hypothetical protein